MFSLIITLYIIKFWDSYEFLLLYNNGQGTVSSRYKVQITTKSIYLYIIL